MTFPEVVRNLYYFSAEESRASYKMQTRVVHRNFLGEDSEVYFGMGRACQASDWVLFKVGAGKLTNEMRNAVIC